MLILKEMNTFYLDYRKTYIYISIPISVFKKTICMVKHHYKQSLKINNRKAGGILQFISKT